MSEELKPCPFCGGTDLDVDFEGGFVSCNSCDTYGPNVDNEWTPERGLIDEDDDDEAKQIRAKAVELWNNRAKVVEPPVILCEIPGCTNEAFYEAWWRKRDPFLMTPTGHLIRIYICKAHETHPFLVANEKKT